MVDPRMLTNPVRPPYAGYSLPVMVLAEIWHHLWPWCHGGFQRQRALVAAELAVALAVTIIWIVAGMGHLRAGAIIGWWSGWSVFEIIIRMQSKPYVKEGPWWGRCYRVATIMDMVSYVGFKNLLIGAGLFLFLKTFALLEF